MNGNGNGFAGNHLGVNLAYTKFFFVTPGRDDEATRVKLRAAGGTVGRGFFNDFDAEGRDTPPHETIQFLVRAGRRRPRRRPGAPYALQVCSKYRPRLKETDVELRRRVGEFAEVTALEGAVRVPQYTSAEMHAYAYKAALPRGVGTRAEERHHHSDEQVAGVVGQAGARSADLFLSARRRRWARG